MEANEENRVDECIDKDVFGNNRNKEDKEGNKDGVERNQNVAVEKEKDTADCPLVNNERHENGIESSNDEDVNTDEDYSTAVLELMRRYFTKWRKRTFPEILHRDQLARAAILVSFCQQVHIYNQEIYFRFHRTIAAVDVTEIMPTSGALQPQGTTVLEAEYKEYFDNSKVCAAEFLTTTENPQDETTNESNEAQTENKSEIETEERTENESATTEMITHDAVAEENCSLENVVSPPAQEVAEEPDTGDILRQDMKLNEQCEVTPTEIDCKMKSTPENEDALKQSRPASTTEVLPENPEIKRNPIEEMALEAATAGSIARSDSDEFHGPFNFQALLRKTNIPRRDSLRRLNEIKTDVKPTLSLPSTLRRPDGTIIPAGMAAEAGQKGEEETDITSSRNSESKDVPISSPKSSVGSGSLSGAGGPAYETASEQHDEDLKLGRSHESCKRAVTRRHAAVQRALTEGDLPDQLQESEICTAGLRRSTEFVRHRPKRLLDSGNRASSVNTDLKPDSTVFRQQIPDHNGNETPGFEVPKEVKLQTKDENSDASEDSDRYVPSDSEESKASDEVEGLENDNNNIISHITILYDSTICEGEYELIPGVFISGLSTDL